MQRQNRQAITPDLDANKRALGSKASEAGGPRVASLHLATSVGVESSGEDSGGRESSQ
jgi:hypothetical protein